MIILAFLAKFWPEKITSRDGCFLQILILRSRPPATGLREPKSPQKCRGECWGECRQKGTIGNSAGRTVVLGRGKQRNGTVPSSPSSSPPLTGTLDSTLPGTFLKIRCGPRGEKKKAYTTTTERKSFGELFWPQRKTFQAGGRHKKPLQTRKAKIFPLWWPPLWGGGGGRKVPHSIWPI